MSKFLIALISSLTLFNMAHAAKSTLTVATVNGIKISRMELEKNYSQNLLFVSGKQVTREKVLNDLINRALGIQRARKNKLHNDPIVKEKMEDIMYHAQVSKDLEPKLKKIVVTDKDVKEYYRQNPEFRTAQILFRVRAKPVTKEWQAALTQAKIVYAAVAQKPDTFAEKANKYSQASNASNGGDMGFQPAARLAPEYYRSIKNKKKGDIVAPVRSQFGYHIIKILAVKDYKAINMTLYKKIVYDQKRDKILASYFSQLRKNANVKILAKLKK